MAEVYKCKRCGLVYGHHPKLPNLPKADPESFTRYLDSTTWRCPGCGTHQDSRDLGDSFLGVGGCGTVSRVEGIDLELLINPGKAVYGANRHGMYFYPPQIHEES